MTKRLLCTLITLISAGAFLSSCAGKRVSISKTNIALGTYVQITVIGGKDRKEDVDQRIEEAFEEIRKYEDTFDYRSQNGHLAWFNQSDHILLKGNDLLFELIKESLYLAEFTNGYFDPTILPIVQLWGFDTDNPSLPTDKKIEENLKRVGFKKLTLLDDRIIKPREVHLDLSAIAKGKIVDIIRDFLIDEDYKNFLINAGGDIYVSGTNASKRKWKIAIQDPLNADRYSGIVEKTDTAIVTSGDYERYFYHDGVKYTHLFNPKTGYPFTDCKSVTVLAADTAFADAVATAVFSMGSDEGFLFLKKNRIEGYIIYSENGKSIESKSTSHFWD
jgi:thiamine biosynthesis lipoprotein